MAHQINRVFIKFKDVFQGRQDEIRNYIVEHFEKDFKERIVEKVERIDATNKIKTTGFRTNLSSWRDPDRNIIISNCLMVGSKQKRYDYKIIFLKEKFHSNDIERIKMALNEVDNLRDKLKLKIAVVKLDSATKLAKEMNIPRYMEELLEVKEEITALEKEYNKKLDNLVENLRIHRENNNINEALQDCDEIIEISKSINRTDLMDKYNNITRRIMSEMIADKEKRELSYEKILNLETEMNKNLETKNLTNAIVICKKIIQIAKSNDMIELIEKYNQILDQLENERLFLENKKKTLINELKKLDKEIEFTLANDKLKDALNYSEKSIQISMTLEDDDLIKKYQFISERIQKRIAEAEEQDRKLLIELEELEQKIDIERGKNNLEVALGLCEKIIQLSRSLNRIDLIDKYSETLTQIKNDIENQKGTKDAFENLKVTIERLNKEGLDALYGNKLVESLRIYKEIKDHLIKYIE
ncbi:MAG: hypothetical protein ACFFDK_03850 [Promethearchaeota archaeon]